jgi:signal recognition particle subunit SRP54
MFNSLSEKLETTFTRLRGRGRISGTDLDVALEEIKTALLEADVNLNVVKDFCAQVREKCLGQKIESSLRPGEMVVKFVYDQLVVAMGETASLNLKFAPPVVIMMVGLQGSGKTTSSGKLAKYLKEDFKRRPLLVPADVYRPAAIDQLQVLGKNLGIEVFNSNAQQKPLAIAEEALQYARNAGFDTVIIDTAGRLQIDNVLMNELADIAESVEPHEILLVADAMTGQEAVNVAKGFDEVLDIDGLILTKLDGDARGGAALSMRAVTGKPIKFVGLGEDLSALEVFHPDRMASRILDMGDLLTLIEKASKNITAEEAKKLEKKVKKNDFTLEDFHSQLKSIRSMGSVGSLVQMIPGMGKVAKAIDEEKADKEFKRVEAIILSMTPKERRDHEILNGGRRLRIAKGSGTSVEEVNKLVKQFTEMRKMMKKFSKKGPNALRSLGNLARTSGGIPRNF